MTPHEAKQLLPVITALAEGKTIQITSIDGWQDVSDPDFSAAPPREWRIKPTPLESWILVTPAGNLLHARYQREALQLHASAPLGTRLVHMREVSGE